MDFFYSSYLLCTSDDNMKLSALIDETVFAVVQCQSESVVFSLITHILFYEFIAYWRCKFPLHFTPKNQKLNKNKKKDHLAT